VISQRWSMVKSVIVLIRSKTLPWAYSRFRLGQGVFGKVRCMVVLTTLWDSEDAHNLGVNYHHEIAKTKVDLAYFATDGGTMLVPVAMQRVTPPILSKPVTVRSPH
jgi:hypothetical protein